MGARKQLVRYYRRLRRYGLNDSHSGNASIRAGETIWMTPTGCCADTLEPSDLVAMRAGEPPPPGASLDAPLHLAVYERNPEAAGVLHSHGPYSIAVCLHDSPFKPVDFEGALYFAEVPVLSIPYDQYVERSPSLVAETLADNPVTVVRGHGVYAWGESLDQAYKWTCSLESAAKIAALARDYSRS